VSQYGLEIEILTKFTDRSRNFQRHENLLLKFGIVAEQRTDEMGRRISACRNWDAPLQV